MIEYIEVSHKYFREKITHAISIGVIKPRLNSACMGCSFWYGDPEIFKEDNNIIGMVSIDDYDPNGKTKFNLTKEFKEYIDSVC